MRVLNLYAGLGGNRKLWGSEHQVTAVEIDQEIAAIYQKNNPADTVIVGDAHQYLLENFKRFDFIWSSPPCPTHSDIRRMEVKKGSYAAKFPDMQLYEEIIFLMEFCNAKWVVENVVGYYEPLIKPVLRGRHYFWSNFQISEYKKPNNVVIRDVNSNSDVFGFSLKNEKLSRRKDQLLRNCLDPQLGLHIFECAQRRKQSVLVEGYT